GAGYSRADSGSALDLSTDPAYSDTVLEVRGNAWQVLAKWGQAPRRLGASPHFVGTLNKESWNRYEKPEIDRRVGRCPSAGGEHGPCRRYRPGYSRFARGLIHDPGGNDQRLGPPVLWCVRDRRHAGHQPLFAQSNQEAAGP